MPGLVTGILISTAILDAGSDERIGEAYTSLRMPDTTAHGFISISAGTALYAPGPSESPGSTNQELGKGVTGAAGADGCPHATRTDALGHRVSSRARESPAREIPNANAVDSGNAGVRSDVVEIVEMLPGRAPEVGVMTNVVAIAVLRVGGEGVWQSTNIKLSAIFCE